MNYIKKRPAIQKMILLDEITKELRKRSVQEPFMDNGGIRALGKWLTPYADGTCTNVRIHQEILQTIDQLQISIGFQDASELRQIVKYYSSGQAKVPQVVGLAKSLVDKWQREDQGKRTSYAVYDRKNKDDDDDDDEFDDGNQDANYKEFRKDLEQMK